eukprot:gene6095-8399_t
MSSKNETQASSCIGSLEPSIHRTFSSVRVPGDDFIYSLSSELFMKLDNYVDEKDPQSITDSKPPLLIKGESGIGKSALLSNWLHRRERFTIRKRIVDEYVFWHAVGCNRQSLSANNLIRRIIVGLKNRFDLIRDVPKENENLCWELPRFLDLASKKARIIVIVIDGINRLLNSEGQEDALTWLPLVYPANIRVILSITTQAVPHTANKSSQSAKNSKLATDKIKQDPHSVLQEIISLSNQSIKPFSSQSSARPHTIIEPAISPDSSTSSVSIIKDQINDIDAIEMNIIDENSYKPKKNRVIQELERRNLPFITVKHLEPHVIRRLIDGFMLKTVNFDISALNTGPYLPMYNTAPPERSTDGKNRSSTATPSRPTTSQAPKTITPGLLLFDQQIAELMNHPMGGSPIFFRLFLRCLYYAVSRGYSLYHVWDQWICARSIHGLLKKILRTFENNYNVPSDYSKECIDRTVSLGGYDSLKLLYAWHPSFQRITTSNNINNYTFISNNNSIAESNKSSQNNSNDLGGVNIIIDVKEYDIIADDDLASSANNSKLQQENKTNDIAEAMLPAVLEYQQTQALLSNTVKQNLSDQQWNSVSQSADLILQQALFESNRTVDETLQIASISSKTNKIDNISALIEGIKQAQKYYVSLRDNKSKKTKKAQTDNDQIAEFTAFNNPAEEKKERLIDEMLANSGIEDDIMYSPTKPTREDGIDNDQSVISYLDDGFETESIIQHDLLAKDDDVNSVRSAEKSMAVDKQSSQRQKIQDKNVANNIQSPQQQNHDNLSVTKDHAPQSSYKRQTLNSQMGLANLDQLPDYFLNGSSNVGFGELLGNALSLLYVARHGLRESELYKILSMLQMKRENSSTSKNISKEARLLNNEIIRNLANIIIKKQLVMADVLKSEDINKTNYIGVGRIVSVCRKISTNGVGFEEMVVSRSDVMKLLEFVEQNTSAGTSSNEDSTVVSTPLIIGNNVNYPDLISSLNKLNKYFKFNDKKIMSHYNANAPKHHLHGHGHNHDKSNNNHKATGGDGADGQYEDYDNFDLNLVINTNANTNTNANAATPGVGGAKSVQSGQSLDQNMDIAFNEEADEYLSLGPVVESSLLTVLCTLGVLYNTENKVLILPPDSDSLRKVIYQSYIISSGGGTLQYWHSLIIQYFQTEPTTLRKCEELPWHLQICKKWTSLKDTLCDLKTFDLMFNNDLKDELMDYWVLLTEGPLSYNEPNNNNNANMSVYSDHASMNSSKVQGLNHVNADDVNDMANLLKDIDKARQLGVSVKEARKKFLLKNQMTPFDVVEEFNKSVELWVYNNSPPPSQIHRAITQISRFLAEFSKLTKSNPSFTRLGIDMEAMTYFGIKLDEIKEFRDNNNTNSNGLTINTNNEGFIADGNSSPKSVLINSNNASNNNLLVSGNNNTNEAKKVNYFDDSNKREDEKVRFPTQNMVNSYLYPYLRWMWIQFPWLALHPAATVIPIGNNMVQHDGDDDHDNNNSSSHGSHEYQSIHHAHHMNSDNDRLLKIWKAKKNDPEIPVFQNSIHKKLASIKPRSMLSMSLERNVEVTYKKIYEEMMAPSHKLKLSTGIARDKFRRNFADELEMNKNIPFSYHTNRAMKNGSLFATYEKQFRERKKHNLDSEFNALNDLSATSSSMKSKHSNYSSKLSSKLKPLGSLLELDDLDDEISRINNEEYLKSHKIDRTGSVLIKNEDDLEYETVLERISRMKTIINKLDIVKREKNRIIADLDNQSLNERNILMETSCNEVMQMNGGYVELLRILKDNPPYIESHVKSLEVEVELAEKQFDELCELRMKLYKEADRLEKVKRVKLTERLHYYQNSREEIANKKKILVKEMKMLRNPKANHGDITKYARFHGRYGELSGGRSVRAGRLARLDDDLDMENSSPPSPSSIQMTKPVIHFMNALNKNINRRTPEIFPGDRLEDVKQRNDEIVKSDAEANFIESKFNVKVKRPHSTSASSIEDSNKPAVVSSKYDEGQLKRIALSAFPKIILDQIEKNAHATSSELIVQHIFDKTESSTAEEFIDRYLEGQKILEDLKNQRLLVDSKLSQLNAEHLELSNAFSNITLSEEKPTGGMDADMLDMMDMSVSDDMSNQHL